MLNINELRRFNLIKHKDYPNPIEVHGFYESEIEDETIIVHESDELYLRDCEPIQLSEDWLKSCGIIGMSTKTLHSVFKLSPINKDKTEYTLHIGNYFNTITVQEVNAKIYKYQHEIQNLYFYLTGKELINND